MKLTRELAAAHARVSIATLARAMALGEIKGERIGRRMLFDPAEVARWIAARELPIATFHIDATR